MQLEKVYGFLMRRSRMISCIILLVSQSLCTYAQSVAVPIQSFLTIPGGLAFQLRAIESSPDNTLLAVLLNSEANAQIILFDSTLQPFRKLPSPKGLKHLTLDHDKLLYSAVRPGTTSDFVICRMKFSDEKLTCIDFPEIPEALFTNGGNLFVTSGGSVHYIDLDSGTIKQVHRYTNSQDIIWSTNSNGDYVLLANGLTGMGYKCKSSKFSNWDCVLLELKSPEQKASVSSKHPDELFFDKISSDASRIYILSGRYKAAEGFKLNVFSSTGQFLSTTLLETPRISAHPEWKVSVASSASDYWIANQIALMNSKILILDYRIRQLGIYGSLKE